MELNTALAAQSYATARPVTAPRPTPDSGGPGQAFSAAASSFVQTLQQGEQAARASVVDGADSQTLVMALAEAQLAVETAVTLRDRVVEAYQEILRMPV